MGCCRQGVRGAAAGLLGMMFWRGCACPPGARRVHPAPRPRPAASALPFSEECHCLDSVTEDTLRIIPISGSRAGTLANMQSDAQAASSPPRELALDTLAVFETGIKCLRSDQSPSVRFLLAPGFFALGSGLESEVKPSRGVSRSTKPLQL